MYGFIQKRTIKIHTKFNSAKKVHNYGQKSFLIIIHVSMEMTKRQDRVCAVKSNTGAFVFSFDHSTLSCILPAFLKSSKGVFRPVESEL